MPEFDPTLLVIALLAVLAPLASRAMGRRLAVPIVVFELLLGILVGPAVLGWAHESEFVAALSEIGLAMLFFVAGTELEASSLRGRSGRTAMLGWLVSLAAGVALGWAIMPGEAAVIIGIALSSTALGTLLPILRDAGELKTPFGSAVGAVGAVGEFGPLVAISLFLGGREPGVATVVLVVFALIAGFAIWLAVRVPRGAMHRAVNATLHTSGQFAVRVLLLIISALVALSALLELDMLLGAFAAGIVWRLLMRDADEADRKAVESKVEGLAFGFLVPIFFIYTGVTFDLQALLDNPALFGLLPVGVVALLLVRGIPSSIVLPRTAPADDRIALGLMGATGLPIIVAVTGIGVDKGLIDTTVASVLVGAGMLSVLVLPQAAMSYRRRTTGAPLAPRGIPIEDDAA